MASSSGGQGTGAGSNKSARLASQRKVMDEATRRRRARKALESLEQDNFHDDPHADLVMSKKALNLFQEGATGGSPVKGPQASAQSMGMGGGSSKGSSKRKSRTTEYYKQRFRKNFAQLLEEEATQSGIGLGQQPAQPDDKKDEQSKNKKKKKDKKKGGRAEASYFSAQAPPSTRPPRSFCAVCGFNDRLYTCVVCGMKYCSLPCLETHRDTRCLKYTS